MMSELGWGYRFERRHDRKTLSVYRVLEPICVVYTNSTTHFERMQLRKVMRALNRSYGSRKELLRTHVEGQDMAGTKVVEDTSQGCTIRSKEEKLSPEAVGLLLVIVFILIFGNKGRISRGRGAWEVLGASGYLPRRTQRI